MEKTSNDSLLLFPCPGCNAQLYFKPGNQQLNCQYCGTNVQIDNTTAPLQEFDLQPLLSVTEDTTATTKEINYKCTRCGSASTFSADTATFVCSYCKFEAVNPDAYKTRTIQPSAMVPFKIGKEKALTLFKEWVTLGSFTPKDVGKVDLQENLRGVYIPFWTYDARTVSKWRGEAGRYYYVTVEEKDSNGKTITRREQRTEWISRSGTFEYSFNDILVCGSNGVPSNSIGAILPFELESLVNFNESYLSGFESDVYNVSAKDGFAKAESLMDSEIFNACANDCTIDTYSDLDIDTSISDKTYKHILLPLWFCTYVYKGKTYPFMINGQTGRIKGQRPEGRTGAVKITLIILAIVLIFYILSKVFPAH